MTTVTRCPREWVWLLLPRLSHCASQRRDQGEIMFDEVTTRQRILSGIVVGLLMLDTVSAQTGQTWYASAANSSTPPSGTACTVASPCTLSYALGTQVSAADTLVLY